jgi:hypothetical protein
MVNRGILLFKLRSAMTSTVPVYREFSISTVIQVETATDTD